MPNLDISRDAFNPRKHYSSVRMQQGRVLTDDDWNENERIEDELYRRTQVDIIGRTGTPDDGFKIEHLDITSGFIDFDIHDGTMYTGGIRFEMDSIEKFRLQKDWLEKKDADPAIPVVADFPNGVNEIFDLVYFEGWKQPVSAVEDSSLLEAALGGPDTTARLRNMRRVKLFRNTGSDKCNLSWQKLQTEWELLHFGTINDENELMPGTNLKVSFTSAGAADDLCSPSVLGGYLGAENQAIRVQVTRFAAGNNRWFFTWGFDNASPLYRVTIAEDVLTVTMVTEPKDQYHWPLSDQVIEILPWSAVLPNNEKVAEQKGILCKVATSYNPDSKSFTLTPAITLADLTEWKQRNDTDIDLTQPAEFLYMRVWNRGSDLASPAEIPFTPGTAVQLGNTGLEVTFTGTTGNNFLAPDGTGNFWVIAARPSTRQSVVPWELTSTVGTGPHGVRFFYSPLAIIKWTKVDATITGEIIHDCRRTFEPLTEDCCSCITVKPGPGWENVFDRFRDDQDICICFKNGIYELSKTVIIRNKGNIKFTGCGRGSQIIVHNNESAFAFISCKDITIRDLSVKNDFRKFAEINLKNLQGVINVSGCKSLLFENISVACKRNSKSAIRQQTCITINSKGKDIKKSSLTTVSIQNSHFNIDSMQTGLLIIDSYKTSIEGNILNGTRANQGIVVAGVNPQNTCIRNNSIQNVFQGIHVGASNSKIEKNRKLSSGPVIISGNNIECLLTASYKRERHGIFVGNCDSLVINENYISLKKENGEGKIWPAMNGIRVFGVFGKRIIIRDNHLDGFGYIISRKRGATKYNIGILIHYLNSQNVPRWWIVEANVTEKLRIEGPTRLFRTSKMIYADRWRPI